MRAVIETRESNDAPARVGAPIWSVESGKSRHEVDATVIRDGVGQGFNITSLFDESELVAQPLSCGTRHGYRAFKRVDGRIMAELITNGREQPGVRGHNVRTRIEKHKIPGTISILCFAGNEANLSDRCCLLIADISAHRKFGPERPRLARHA